MLGYIKGMYVQLINTVELVAWEILMDDLEPAGYVKSYDEEEGVKTYLFYIEGLDRFIEVMASSKREAKGRILASLSDQEITAITGMECLSISMRQPKEAA